MVACHLARTQPVDCLVCDRTFATLDATAARLMVSGGFNPCILIRVLFTFSSAFAF